jgi:RNA polymerase sigma-70 factor, ECF subfamily
VTDVTQKEIFDEWLSKHSRLIYKIVRSYSSDAIAREDLFQEILIQVWASIPSFRNECAVTTWLYRIALNVAIRWSTKQRRASSAESEYLFEKHLTDDREVENERLAWLYQEIHKLDEIDRSIMLLLLDGLSYKEMAIIIGISESNIGVKINRIKKRLATKNNNETSWN